MIPASDGEESIEIPAERLFLARIDTETSTALARLCRAHGVTLQGAMGRSRLGSYSRARAACWAYQRAKGMSLASIGQLWGRDHTSVLVGIRRHEERMRSRKGFGWSVDVSKVTNEVIAGELEAASSQLVAVAKVLEKIAARLRTAG